MSGSSRRLYVTVIAHNVDTLRGLTAYLSRAGVTTCGTRLVEELLNLAPPRTSAVVVFPDEFNIRAVLYALAGLRAHRPSALPIVVTQEWKQFERFSAVHDGSLVVVPKPAWAWTILDAIRARLGDSRSGELN